MFYFVKHGKTDYSKRNAKIYQGFGVNLSPMSELGIEQIKKRRYYIEFPIYACITNSCDTFERIKH